ncbi:MAG: pilus assembly protein PilP [Pseudomonadota bacterium]
MKKAIKKINGFLLGLNFSWRNRYIFILAFVFFVFIFSYFFYLKPAIANKKLIYKQIATLMQKLKEQQELLKNYDLIEKKLIILKRQVFEDCENKNKKIKHEIMPWAIRHGLSQDLRLNDLKVVSGVNKEFYTELFVTASVNNSNERNIKEFLYQLENLKYHVFINKFKWGFLDAKDTALESKNKIYILFSILVESSFFQTNQLSNLKRNAIFNAKKINMCINYLTHYPIDQLKMVGFLIRNQIEKNWGLIKLPNEHICKVEIGSEVGIEKTRVVFIDSKKMMLQEKNNKKNIELIIKNKDFSYG